MDTSGLKALHIVQSGQLQRLVIENLKSYIVESRLRPGDSLPTEKELSDALGVSRTVVREALKSLETLGVIEARHGVGRFLKEFDVEVFLEQFSYDLALNVRDFRDILHVRIALEAHFLAQCIPLYTAEELAVSEGLLQALEERIEKRPSVSEEELIPLHTEFHLSLYRGLDNALLLGLIRIFSRLQTGLSRARRLMTQDRGEFVALHRKLLDAIKKKDIALAHACLMEHFKEAVAWGPAAEGGGNPR